MIPQTKHKHIHTIRKVYDPKWNRTILAGFIFIIIVRVDAAWLTSVAHCMWEKVHVYTVRYGYFSCVIFLWMRVQGIKYDMMILNIKLNIGVVGKNEVKKKRRKKVIVEGHAFFKRNEILRLYPSIFLCLSSIWKQR